MLQAAAFISDHCKRGAAKSGAVKKAVNDGALPPSERKAIESDIDDILTRSGLNDSAEIYVINPDNYELIRRRSTVGFDTNLMNQKLPIKYYQVANKAMANRARTLSKPSASEPDGKVELVGYAPVHLETVGPNPNGRHGYVTLVAVPRDVVFETILRNQTYTLAILGVVGFLTVVFGWVFGRWFIRPLLEINDVTADFTRATFTSARTSTGGTSWAIWRAQVNSVVDRLSEVIGQIREMTSSVSTASSELNSSAHQLAQGSTEQAATLQEIAGSLQSVDCLGGA